VTLHPLDMPHLPKQDRTEIDAAEAAFNAARARFVAEYDRRHSETPRLVYAARLRCKCGAGVAYLTSAGVWGSWFCSAVLKGEGGPAEHDKERPFASFEITSELQPSAEGQTTRPKESTR